MTTSEFNEERFASVREMGIWKRLSADSNFPWSETLIDRYQDKLNWKSLSGNSNVLWTASMLEKYQNQLNWKVLSKRACNGLYSIENLKRFSSNWDWSALTTNVCWTMEKVEEFKDFIDWSNMINNWENSHLYTLEFFEKYKDYFFSIVSLKQSRLWDDVMDIYKDKLIEQILAQ